MRRPISADKPMWLIHIDTWNLADPQKIIDMVPEDIRPYVVFNISLSINHDATTGKWLQVEYGYETAKSWLRTCAENRVWAMIQPSSGGFCHFSDFDTTVYEEFYRDYPNFIGFNYAEQFWGFDDQWSVTWLQRIAHFTNLMKLNQKYGGYLVASWCGSFWGANINPVAMMKRNPDFAAICKEDPEHFILCEKFTSKYGFFDIESTCLGSYLSGYSGQYGIRFDECGWSDASGNNDATFPVPAGAIPVIEHVMLTGQTVIDGPETIPQQSSREISTGTTSDGFTTRRWEFYPQFHNISMDIFRKILDGTIRILSRKEVIDRTKLVIVNDVTTGDDRTKYSSPETLFTGLYLMDSDGSYLNQKSWFKKTGRYPAIPTVYQLADTEANSFQVKVNKSAYSTRWSTTAAKTTEFNNLFAQEYTGDLYAGRHENGWVTYNPYKTGQTASASIPFKYNTCDHMDLTYSQYTTGVIKEYANKLTFYLTNYDNANTSLKTDVIKIYGSSSEPTYSYTDRASHQTSSVTKSWSGGVLTLNVVHNGPLDLTVNCSGTATGRLTSYKTSSIAPPSQPSTYMGVRQYEAENFDYKNITRVYTNAINSGVSNYTAQGFVNFGTNSAASIKKTVKVIKSGAYRLDTKYSVTGGSASNIDLYVNGTKVTTLALAQTSTNSDWATNKQNITLNAGTNTIELKANTAGTRSVYFDNILIVPTLAGDGNIIQENATGFCSLDGTVDSNNTGYTGSGFANTSNAAGASINWKINFGTAVTKSFTFRYASTDARTANLIINGKTAASNINFPGTGSWNTWDFVTVYTGSDSGYTDVRLEATSSSGLPNIDYLEVAGGTPVSCDATIYDFSKDAATTIATIPPALDMTVGYGNGATAGVASFTDTNNSTSNSLRAYSGGERNGTGVIDLNLFPSNATDYSVTWKQCLASIEKDYKVGVLLRGNNTVGTNATGYVAGIRQGYLFIAYTANGATTPHSEFRIYKSTSATSLSMLVNASVSELRPAIETPVWYRASVSGSTTAILKFEYSTDGTTWAEAAATTDSSSPFTSGASQFAWGLAAGNWDFYVDDIAYEAVSSVKSGAMESANLLNETFTSPKATVISSEYYSLAGERISLLEMKRKGIYIQRDQMSDGTIVSTKIHIK
jgi:hypothetical protein